MEFEPRLSASRVLSLLLCKKLKKYREPSMFILPITSIFHTGRKIEGMEIYREHLLEGHKLNKQSLTQNILN